MSGGDAVALLLLQHLMTLHGSSRIRVNRRIKAPPRTYQGMPCCNGGTNDSGPLHDYVICM